MKTTLSLYTEDRRRLDVIRDRYATRTHAAAIRLALRLAHGKVGEMPKPAESAHVFPIELTDDDCGRIYMIDHCASKAVRWAVYQETNRKLR